MKYLKIDLFYITETHWLFSQTTVSVKFNLIKTFINSMKSMSLESGHNKEINQQFYIPV